MARAGRLGREGLVTTLTDALDLLGEVTATGENLVRLRAVQQGIEAVRDVLDPDGEFWDAEAGPDLITLPNGKLRSFGVKGLGVRG